MVIKNKVSNLIQNILLKFKLRIEATTEFEELKNFMKTLRPIKTNHELIRIGGLGDGGYLIPNDLDGIRTCFSPGVAETSSFENELSIRNIKSYMADFSVESPAFSNNLFIFDKKFLGNKNDLIYFTLETWINKYEPDDFNMILQMDIEGGEYPVIFETSSDTLKKFRIIVIEFHDLDLLRGRNGFKLIKLTLEKILNDFEIVHIHPNNHLNKVKFGNFEIPRLLEITFLRKDRILNREYIKKFPNNLDSTNDNRKPDYPLPACWYEFE